MKIELIKQSFLLCKYSDFRKIYVSVQQNIKKYFFRIRNQKGRSPRIVLKDFVIGETNQTHGGKCNLVRKFTIIVIILNVQFSASDDSSFQLSPILLGILLTLLLVAAFIVLKIYSKRRTKSNDTLNNSKQSNSLLCNQDATKVKHCNFNKWTKA